MTVPGYVKKKKKMCFNAQSTANLCTKSNSQGTDDTFHYALHVVLPDQEKTILYQNYLLVYRM